MNPLLADALGSIIRKLLVVGAAYLVNHGIWTEAASTRYVEGLTLFLLAVLWGVWKTYGSRQKIVTGLAMPAGSTEHQVEATIATGVAPPVTLPKTHAPKAIRPRKVRHATAAD